MKAATDQRSYDCKELQRLNRLSLSRSFIPQVDIDWNATTTDAEYESLYPAWSLLAGTGLDGSLDSPKRIQFVKYQQVNLMIFSALLERYAITALIKLYDADSSGPFYEYLGHFIKEESYHATMFMRAAEKIQSSMPGFRPLPTRGLDWILRWLFRLLNAIPGKRLRSSITFTFFRFGELVTLYAHKTVQSTIQRKESLISQVWAYHALDESRHLVFDAMVLERNKLSRPLAWIPPLIASPCSALVSLSINANEIWAARQLGIRVHRWQLPLLMRRTQATFKRRVFSLWSRPFAKRGWAAKEI